MASEAQMQALQSLKDKQWAEEELAKKESHNFSLSEMLGNAPGDLWQIGEEAAHMIRHPIDTASAVGNLALGGAQKLIPGEQDAEVYACGSEEMIHDAQRLLVKSGLKSENFYSDAFVSSS